MATQKEKDLLVKVRDRFKIMKDADEENLRKGMENMKFINLPGYQWDYNQKQERGLRPCYEFNKTRVNTKKVINHIRTNRPQGKVRGVEGTDKKQAEYREGLIRNIWNVSDGDTIMDYAAEYQVSGGMGAWRVDVDYSTDDSFDQDIQVAPIHNPFCLFNDPGAKDMLKRDAEDWILTEKIPISSFKKEYKDIDAISFDDHEFDDEDEWEDEERIRIAEYWWKEPTTKEIWQLITGEVVDAETDEAQAILSGIASGEIPEDVIKKKRVVNTNKIMMAIVSGSAVLEGPTEWAGTEFPFIKVFGEYMVVDGRIYWYGLGEFAKDAQKSYNVSRTAISETIATAPLSHYWATTTQAKGHMEKWEEAHRKNFPVQLYDPDPMAPGPPSRMGGPDVPIALMQESALASNEIDEVMGIFPPDRGEQSGQSGRAIYAQQEQGDTITFNFPDNMAKGIQRTYEILIDLIPNVWDTEMEKRILGADGEEDYVQFNQFVTGDNGEQIKINDLSVGRFDVTVTTGPSYSTKRQEFVETFGQLFTGNEQFMMMFGDLFFKAMDHPYSDEMAERAKVMLPPQIQGMINKDQAIPPEIQMLMEQAKQGMAMVEAQMAEVQQAANDAEIAKSEVEKLMAQLDKEKAQFEAQIAKQLAGIAEKDARLTIDKVQMDSEGVIESARQTAEANTEVFNTALTSVVSDDIGEAMKEIGALVVAFNKQTEETLQKIQEEKDNRPIVKEVKAVRENGQLKAVPVYEDID